MFQVERASDLISLQLVLLSDTCVRRILFKIVNKAMQGTEKAEKVKLILIAATREMKTAVFQLIASVLAKPVNITEITGCHKLSEGIIRWNKPAGIPQSKSAPEGIASNTCSKT